MHQTSRLTVFTGHFGSGKTEIALNYSIRLARRGETVTIVDLDIVNPFFRSSEAKDVLNREGVRVLAPTFAGTTVDVPSLPSEIYAVFQDKRSRVVFDVGGDEKGAAVLGRYHPYFNSEPYDMFYVINTKRPLSGHAEQVINTLKAVELNSRLKVTHLINNTNLMHETTIEHILEGQDVVEHVSGELNIPVAYISGIPAVLALLPHKYREKGFPIELYMHPPWDMN
ncbi:MAG: ATP-binding protein [Clostridiales bacterium]|nr:ATP-binding protein [Clostridiales bacterium]